MRVDVVDQLGGILAHLEEVRFFLRGLHLSAAVGALAVLELRGREERFARHTVHAFIIALIDVALVVHVFENLLHLLDVIFVGGADKAVVRRADKVPQALDLARDVVDVFLRRDARRLGLFLDLLTVLVRAGLQIDVVALKALEARDAVGEDRFVGVSDVRLARCIGDRRGDVILLSHSSLSP